MRLLTLASLLTALSTGFVLAVAAFLVLARVPAVALLGHWSATALAAMEPVPAAAGLAAGVTVLTLLASAARRGAAAGRDLAVAAATCRRLGAGRGRAGRRGRHGAGRLRRARTRRACGRVHRDAAGPAGATSGACCWPTRRAHLRHHHHLYVQLAELGAAANPLLRPLAAAVRVGVERWADEVAAAEVVTGRWSPGRWPAPASLAPAPAQVARRHTHVALGAVDSAVAERTRALLAPPPSRRRALAAAVVALMLLPVAAAAVTAGDTEHRVEMAQAAWARSH